MTTRRGLILAALSAPFVVRTPGLLMPIPHLTARASREEAMILWWRDQVTGAIEKTLVRASNDARNPIHYDEAGIARIAAEVLASLGPRLILEDVDCTPETAEAVFKFRVGGAPDYLLRHLVWT